MKSLRARFVLASMFVLSASTASAQASRISCQDGTKPKVGHFSCWGHGGLVREALKSAEKADAKPASKAAKKGKAASSTKQPVAKKARPTVAKADRKKADRKKADRKKAGTPAHAKRPTRQSAK